MKILSLIKPFDSEITTRRLQLNELRRKDFDTAINRISSAVKAGLVAPSSAQPSTQLMDSLAGSLAVDFVEEVNLLIGMGKDMCNPDARVAMRTEVVAEEAISSLHGQLLDKITH